MTTYADGVFQYGGMPVGGSMLLPLMGREGKAIWVDPANGDDENTGRKPTDALDTVGAAYALTTNKAGDVIYFLNDGNTSGSSREASLITWSNDNTHLVGLCAYVGISQRSRITPVSTAALTAAPVIDVTGNGNIFSNVQIAHFGANTNGIGTQGVAVSGERNVFDNVHMVGIVNDHTGDEATGVDLLIDGGSENLFRHCTIGIDTVARSTTNASLELTTGAARNVFENCLFPMLSDSGDSLFVKADGSGDLDRFTLFESCKFINAMESGATILTSAVSVHNTAGGLVAFDERCMIIGASNVAAADNGNVYVGGVGGAATGALGIIATQ